MHYDPDFFVNEIAEEGTVVRGNELFGGVPTPERQSIKVMPDLSAIRVAAWRSNEDAIVLGNVSGDNLNGLDIRSLLD